MTKKREYSKPVFIYESFTLSQNIASGCEGIAIFGEKACPVLFKADGISDVALFHGMAENCQWSPDNADDYICYHAPSEMNNVFSS